MEIKLKEHSLATLLVMSTMLKTSNRIRLRALTSTTYAKWTSTCSPPPTTPKIKSQTPQPHASQYNNLKSPQSRKMVIAAEACTRSMKLSWAQSTIRPTQETLTLTMTPITLTAASKTWSLTNSKSIANSKEAEGRRRKVRRRILQVANK